MLTLTCDLVEIVHIATFLNEVFTVDGVVDEVDAVIGAELSVTHLNGDGRVHGHLVASLQLACASHNTHDPVFLARHKLWLRELEAHGRKLCHRLAQRTVVYDVG